MRNIISLIKNLFKIAKLLSVDDSGNLRFYNVSFMGKSGQKILGFSPYGLMHNPPVSSMVLLWSQNAQESNGIGMADDPKNRTLKNLKSGEVALGNYETGHYIYFDENGLCTVVAKDLKFQIDDSVTVIGTDLEFQIDNSVTVIGTDVEITSSTLTHNGTNIGDTHVHPQGNDAAGDSEVDTDGPQ